jgi:hypothetical protein
MSPHDLSMFDSEDDKSSIDLKIFDTENSKSSDQMIIVIILKR